MARAMATLFLLYCSCVPHYPAVSPVGTVAEVDGPRVLVIFRDMSGREGIYAYNWFYFERADSLEVGREVRITYQPKPD